MPAVFENNIFLFIFIYALGIVGWFLLYKVSNLRIRRAARASIIFLVFPIFFFGHPFLYYQTWMLIFAYIADFNLIMFLVSLGIWGLFLLFSQIGASKN